MEEPHPTPPSLNTHYNKCLLDLASSLSLTHKHALLNSQSLAQCLVSTLNRRCSSGGGTIAKRLAFTRHHDLNQVF